MKALTAGLVVVSLAGLVPAAPPSAIAQTPAPSVSAPAPFDAAARRQALAAIRARIDKGYVHMDRRAAIVAPLEAGAAQGLYDTADPVEFARRVTRDLQAATGDTHLYLNHEPDWYASATGPQAPGAADRSNAFEQQIARYTNHGLVEMKILPGNIRYLRIEGFAWIETETSLAYDGAMAFLKGGDAIVIDLRGNGGGWVQSARYLISHFLDAGALYSTARSSDGADEQERAADTVPAGRIKGKPVYLLIDRQSRSAAEQVAYTLRAFKVAELVGATTAGASYTSDDTAIAPGFRLSVSISREINAITGTDWEGAGVTPTVAVDPATALEVAQLRAIDRLLPTSNGIARNQLAWAKPAVAAALAPVALSDREMKAWAGVWGAASLSFHDGGLWLNRPGRDPYRLRAMTRDGLFQAVAVPSLRVRVTGRTLEVLRIDPEMNQTFER